MIDKLFNIIKISFPIISIMGFVKISVFYSQFGINVLYYFDLIDYFTLFLNDLYTFIILIFFIGIVLYIPGSKIAETNSDYHNIALYESSFKIRLLSYVKQYFIILMIWIIPWFFINNSSYNYIIKMTLIPIFLTIFLREIFVYEYNLNDKKSNLKNNYFISNFIMGIVVLVIFFTYQAKEDAKYIKINCKNNLNYMVTQSKDTINLGTDKLYIGKTKQYIYVYDIKNISPIIYSSNYITTLNFKEDK